MNKAEGNWRAVVIDNMDPLKSGRVKIEIPGLRLRNLWAEPAISIGGSAIHGSYAIPRVGDKIFVFFDGGDVNFPIYFATSPAQKDIPVAFDGGSDPLIKTRNNQVVKTAEWSEPKTNATVEYPYAAGIKFPNGTLIVVDESNGETKVAMYHPSSSYEEYRTDGDHIARVAKDDYEIIMGDKFMYVGGSVAEVIAQDFGIDVGGNFEQKVTGNVTEETMGDVTIKVLGAMTEQVMSNSVEQITGDKNFNVVGNFVIQTAQALRIIAQAINLVAATNINLTAPTIVLKGITQLGPVGTMPVHVLGSSFCPFIGAPVTGGSTTVFGSP